MVPRLGITFGDPAGVGPEIALRSLSSIKSREYAVVLIGRRSVLEKNYSTFLNFPLTPFPSDKNADLSLESVYIYDIPSDDPLPVNGKGSANTARESLCYINEAVSLCKKGLIDAIVTGPVNKGLIEKSGTPFMGHTEYIAKLIGEKDPVMMMFSEKYRVALVTTHYAISEVPSLVNQDSIMHAIKTAHMALSRIDGKIPRIAVAGLDPHCGDDGAIGSFDRDVTGAVVERAKTLGMDVHGPYSADTLFMESKWKGFDCAIAIYHDQGLIPFKILAFEKGVNVTLGLSIVRTSVDHGTAFDIAGKGVASFESMIAAMNLAARLSLDVRQQSLI